MAKKTKRLVKGAKKRENKVLDCLPLQKDSDVSFFDTRAGDLKSIEGAEEFFKGLCQFKVKFLSEIQEWSKRYGVRTDVRVYFTPKSGG